MPDSRTPESPKAARSVQDELAAANAKLVEQEKFAILGALVPGLAHDINTPIGIAVTAATAVEDFAQNLQAKLGGERVSRAELLALAAQIANASNLIASNLERAADLIGSLKAVAADQASEAEMSVELVHYVQGVVRVHQPVLRSGRVQVSVDAPHELYARIVPGMLSQIVSNLIMNALAHAFEGLPDSHARRIELSLKRKDDRIVLTFADNGRGVSAEVRERMFEAHFTTRRGSGGSGLGLHIVETMAQRLGGSVSVADAGGPGLTLRVELPYLA